MPRKVPLRVFGLAALLILAPSCYKGPSLIRPTLESVDAPGQANINVGINCYSGGAGLAVVSALRKSVALGDSVAWTNTGNVAFSIVGKNSNTFPFTIDTSAAIRQRGIMVLARPRFPNGPVQGIAYPYTIMSSCPVANGGSVPFNIDPELMIK